jgi:hypothetical protein
MDVEYRLTILSATVVVLPMLEAPKWKKPIAGSLVLGMPPKLVDLVVISQPTPKVVPFHLHQVLSRHMVHLVAIQKPQPAALFLALLLRTTI